jgi:glycogen operon protein
MEKLINYELHVFDLTANCQHVKLEDRGKFMGVCSPFIISHLKSLGVNCVQLMPVFDSVGTHWNYDSTSWFDLNPKFGTLSEFKAMVDTLQASGIKVVLDVVFNHVANDLMDKFKDDGVKFYDWDITGCGNTVDVKGSLPVIMKSIKYWLRYIGVDGLRFDLADVMGREGGEFNPKAQFFTEMEQYKDKILIAEPWSCASYSLNMFPDHWIELNDQIRDAVRKGGTYYCGKNYKKYMGFATYHDGFTLQDLVSYNSKHNHANGENNKDGCDNNLSNNHGAEGYTDNPWIIAAREETKKRMIENLKTSSYHITILMGDELGRTQYGNNNGYLRPNPVTWP